MCTQDLQEAKLICLQCVSVENNLALKILLEWRYQDVNKHMWMHLKSLKQVPWYSGKKKLTLPQITLWLKKQSYISHQTCTPLKNVKGLTEGCKMGSSNLSKSQRALQHVALWDFQL